METAKTYFKLACRLIQPAPAMMIAVGGLSGTGKSALARALAPRLPPPPGAIVLRSDVLRKRLFGVDETDRLPGDAYTPDASSRVYQELARQAHQVLAQGFTVIVDAVFARRHERQEVETLAQRSDVPFVGLFLVVDLPIRLERIRARVGDASDATASVAREQESYDLGTLEWLQLDASSTLQTTLERALSMLQRYIPNSN